MSQNKSSILLTLVLCSTAIISVVFCGQNDTEFCSNHHKDRHDVKILKGEMYFQLFWFCFVFFPVGITTPKNFWKPDVDAVASGLTVLHCVAEL